MTEPPSTLRREILDELSYQGRHYFVLSGSWGGATIIDSSIHYLRYDTAGVVVSVDELETDSTDDPIPLPIVAAEYEFLEYFDLRSPIGDTLHYDSANYKYYSVIVESAKQVTIGRDTLMSKVRSVSVHVPAQPIVIDDVLQYLLAALQLPTLEYRVYEIGGADLVSYADIMRVYARQRGIRLRMICVPVLSPYVSSFWRGARLSSVLDGRRAKRERRHDAGIRFVASLSPRSYVEAARA